MCVLSAPSTQNALPSPYVNEANNWRVLANQRIEHSVVPGALGTVRYDEAFLGLISHEYHGVTVRSRLRDAALFYGMPSQKQHLITLMKENVRYMQALGQSKLYA